MKIKSIITLLTIFCASQVNAQNNYVNEDFNGATTLPTGWTNTAVSGTQTWNFGIDGASATGNQNINGTEFAHFDDDALGGGSINNTVSLLTPVFDNSGSTVTSLEFDYNLRTFNGIADSFYVDVFDGISWNRVFSTFTNDCGNYFGGLCASGFPHANIDISAYKNANCQVRFTYHDGNDWGWYVGLDNVQIWSPLPFDLGVTNIIRPVSICGLTAADSVVVEIRNLGSNPVSNFNVGFTLNGGMLISETVNSTIPAGDTLVYKFNTTANLSVIGSYQLATFTLLSNDGNNANDTSSLIIQNEPAFAPTYNESFENANHLWKVSGTNASWQRGVPIGSIINSAPSGNNAFVTNLSGPYNSNETSYLTSPCFDFSASVGDPIMTFSLFISLETFFDRVWMESSIDGGNTWTKIQASPNPSNWYNDTSLQTWTGINSSWFIVENILTGLGGQSQVKLRFAFSSDGSSVLEGVGIDNFSIRNPQLFDISLNSLDYPVAASAPECGYGIEFITVELENKGANALNNFNVAYVVDGGAPVVETITSPLASNTTMFYTFSQSYDFSIIKNYNIDVYATATNDTFQPNDSILNSVVNNTNIGSVSIPYNQNFDSWTPGTVFSNTNGVIGAGWSINGLSQSDYTWRVANGATNRSGATGPDADHTGGNFMYTEASSGSTGDTASITSPCINLTGKSGAKLSFWYHRYGNNIISPIYVDIYDGAQWHLSHDQVGGATHANGSAPFLQKTVDLNTFAGKKIKLRFRAISGGCCGGDMAIDDIFVWEPSPKNVAIVNVVSPSNCYDSLPQSITVNIYNLGDSIIPIDSLTLFYQVDNLPVVSELGGQNIQPYSYLNFTFSQLQTTQFNKVKIWAQLNGDSDLSNDTIESIHSNSTKALPYIENFEQMDNEENTNCWNFTPFYLNGNLWRVGDSSSYLSNNSVPAMDHTIGSAGGQFIHSFRTLSSSIFVVESPEIDLTTTSNAYLGFWHHIRRQSTGGPLYVELLPNPSSNTYIVIDSIFGPVSSTVSGPWSYYSTNLSMYSGDTIRLRFRAYGDNTINYHIAIDDFSVTASPLVSIKEQILENQISLYPNPSTGIFNIRSEGLINQIEVRNVNGKLILQQANQSKGFQLDLSGNAKGVYFIKVNSGSQIINKKIILN